MGSSAMEADSLPTELPRKPPNSYVCVCVCVCVCVYPIGSISLRALTNTTVPTQYQGEQNGACLSLEEMPKNMQPPLTHHTQLELPSSGTQKKESTILYANRHLA